MSRRPTRVGRRDFLVAAGGIGLTNCSAGLAGGRRSSAHRRTDADGTGAVELVVRFDPAEAGDGGGTKSRLETHAERTQRPFRRITGDHPDVTVERSFWLANAALVTVDPRTVSREWLQRIEHVTRVHPSHGGALQRTTEPTGAAGSGPTPSNAQESPEDVTWPLERVDANLAWDVHGTRGDGADVAVLDTGIDPSGHEGLAASFDDGSWAEFDGRGSRVDSAPNDADGHGTAVSGLVAGGTNDDGAHYGVAPEATVHHAKVVTPGSEFAGIVAGMEWAVDRAVDVISMSVGFLGYDDLFVEPVRNALDSGTLVVATIGNAGHYTAVSPGALPSSLSVGMVSEDGTVDGESGGEVVDTDRYWGADAPASWHSEYTLPDVTAPGVDVPVPEPGGSFGTESGSSYSTPITAGVAALAMAATDAAPTDVHEAIRETARHPAAADPFDVDPGTDARYGSGTVSALAAISHLRASETLTGTVTDSAGSPLEGVTVATELGPRTTTNSEGEYELTLPPEEQPVGATGLGYELSRAVVDPSSTDGRDFQLDVGSDPEMEMTDRMAERTDPGSETTATFGVANAESLTVDVETTGVLAPGQLTLTVDGSEARFGEPVALGDTSGGESVAVGITPDASVVVGQFRVSYEFEASGSTLDGRGRTVHVHPDPLEIAPGDPPSLQAPVELVAPRTTIRLQDGVAEESQKETAAIEIDKPLTLTAADGASPRVEFADEPPNDGAVVLADANDVTVSGLTIDASGAAVGVQLGVSGDPRNNRHTSGVTVRNVSVSGAAVGIASFKAFEGRIENNDVTARRVGISVAERSTPTIRNNAVEDVQRGIDVMGRVAAIEGNEISNVARTGIRVDAQKFLIARRGHEIGPIRDNTVTAARTGIHIPGYVNRPVEANELSDISGTAIAVDGGVFAPIRSNTIDGAQRGIVVSEFAQVASVTDNELRNVRDPAEDAAETSDTAGTETASESTDQPGSTPATRTTDAGPPGSTAPPTGTEASDPEGTTGSGSGAPGFGVGTAAASLGGLAYLLRRRLGDDEES